MKIKQITETTTAGSIATTETALGGTQSRGNPSIYGGKKAGSLFKGKKTSAPYANSINESAELSEAQLEEDDVIVVPGQGRSRKNGLVPHGKSRVDHEVEMARSDLFSAAKNAQQVFSMIKDVGEDEGLDGWVQEKIIKANDYLNTIREYLEGKQVQGVAEGASGIEQKIIKLYKQGLSDDEIASRLKIDSDDVKSVLDDYEWVADTTGEGKGVAEGAENSEYDQLVSNVVNNDIQRRQAAGLGTPERLRGKPRADVVLKAKNLGVGLAQLIKDLDSKYQSTVKQGMAEGAKVDRMVKHIEKSEKKLGKSKDEAENIAWATANKRGMLDNKNKKA
jgi:hypothetical protein